MEAVEAKAEDVSATESILTSVTSSEPKLWAGKFKTVDDLEEAYKSAAKVFQENQQLKSDMERYSKAPEEYIVPENSSLRSHEIAEIKSLAKNALLTQEQFAKLSKEMETKVKAQIDSFDKAKADVGDKNLNVLTDYVKSNYPERLHDTILSKLIKDKDAMSDAMKHRDQLLNSQAPGISKASAGSAEKYDGQREVMEAAKLYERERTPDNRRKLIKLAEEVGEARKR